MGISRYVTDYFLGLWLWIISQDYGNMEFYYRSIYKNVDGYDFNMQFHWVWLKNNDRQIYKQIYKIWMNEWMM